MGGCARLTSIPRRRSLQSFYKHFVNCAKHHADFYSVWLAALNEVGGRYGYRTIDDKMTRGLDETRDNLSARLAVFHLFHEVYHTLDRAKSNRSEFDVRSHALGVVLPCDVGRKVAVTHFCAGAARR